MKIHFFFAATALVAGAACSSAAVTNENGDAGENDASSVDAPSDASAAIDSGRAHDSGALADSATTPDSGSTVTTTEPPDGGCSFESEAAERSGSMCTKNVLESCNGDQLLLECDCITNTCTCSDDTTGTSYATFTPTASICADATEDGGCSSITGLAADAKTHCGIY